MDITDILDDADETTHWTSRRLSYLNARRGVEVDDSCLGTTAEPEPSCRTSNLGESADRKSVV